MKNSGNGKLIASIVGCLLVQLCVGILYLWSVFKSSAIDFYGWADSSVNMVASIMLFCFCFGNLVGGILNDKIGPKKVSIMGCCLFGGGILLAQASEELAALAEFLDLPVSRTLAGQGCLSDQHPLMVGQTGFWGLEFTHSLTANADVILGLGTRFGEADSSSWYQGVTFDPDKTTFLQIDIDPNEIGRNYPVEIGAIGDLKIGLAQILEEVKKICPKGKSNPELRAQIAKAKAANMPNENIERCIKKAAGSEDKNSYEEMVYEGYGPNGVAVIIESLTDNRNRTAGDLRHYFDKCGGNLGQNGCVSYLFTKKGQIVIDNSEGELDEEKVMEDCFDAGAEDVDFDEDTIEVYTGVNELREVREALEKKGYTFLSAEPAYIPSTYTALPEDAADKMTRLMDLLDDCDDVQGFWHNWEM